MSFDAKQKLRQIQGRDYLDVKWRIAWMRDEHPAWGIDTAPMQIVDAVIVKSVITDETGRQIASGIATVRSAGAREQSWAGRDYEKAETAAIGRALSHAGYGTQFTEDDADDNLSDAPVEHPRKLNPGSTKQGNGSRPATGTRVGVVLKRGVVRVDKSGKPYLFFRAETGETTALFSRAAFRDKGYCAENDWRTVGEEIVFDPQISVVVVMQDNGYWDIDPATIPPFDPAWTNIKQPELSGMPVPEFDGDIPF